MSACGYIGITDFDWYRNLLAMGSALEEVNFWRPSGRLTNLPEGTPFFFKLKKKHGDAICGFAICVRALSLSVREAWDFLGRSNGARSLEELRGQLSSYLPKGELVSPQVRIGCQLLIAPVFFPEDAWIAAPSDWSGNIVQGASRPLSDPEMSRIWRTCLLQAQGLDLGAQSRQHIVELGQQARYGRPALVAPRLGQGTFRAGVLHAYERACAITREHSVPVLEAAHIRPYAEGGTHDISNGVLLRSDIHRLFDAGYVTITPTGHFEVSGRLREDFNNGRVYYQMHGQPIQLPPASSWQPDRDLLRWHNDHRYLATPGAG
jgi:putative restriction endonuclease